MTFTHNTQTIFWKHLFILSFVLIFGLHPYELHARAEPGKYGGQVVFATSSDPKSFNSILAKETSTTAVLGPIFEGLTTVNPYDATIIPNIAHRWDVSDDGLTWTFYLREDVRFNDGVAMTADDVLFTFNDVIYNQDIPSSSRDIFTIDGKEFNVTKIDDYTVQFQLPVKFAPFLRGMTQEILPKHILEKSVQDGSFNFTWGIDTDPKQIIGTGPYRMIQYQPGQRIVYEANPYYWKKSKEGDPLPYIPKIIRLIVQNVDVSLLQFLEGSVDSYGLRGTDYPLLKPLEEERDFTVYDMGPDTSSTFLVFNQNTSKNADTQVPFVDPVKLSWFKDLQFRKAVGHAIDRKKMVEIVLNGLGYEQQAAIGLGAGYFHNDNVKKYHYDLQLAKNILHEAGYIDRDNDGVIEDAQGHPVEFNLITNSGGTERIDIAGIIRHDLSALGMNVNFQQVEFNTLVGKLTSTFEWDAVIIGLTGGIEPHFGKNVWTSSGQLHMWYPRQKEPQTEWEKRIDEIFIAGVQELDIEKRKVLYDEFQDIVAEYLPFIYTVLNSQNYAVRNKFENLDPTNYGGAFHNLEELIIKPEYR
ncbi:MAG: ABC transporter substrate-binding protein [Candidatus Omnitrophica bacterium]|nr:ABC transporter substrate-binding protein [Candidatus Omnitrophota bacterium]